MRHRRVVRRLIRPQPRIIGASLLSIVFGGVYPFMVDPTMLLSVGFLLIVGSTS